MLRKTILGLAVLLIAIPVVLVGIDAAYSPSCPTNSTAGTEVIIPGETMHYLAVPGDHSADLVLDVVRDPFNIPGYQLDPNHGHIHPNQSETFEVVEGRAAFLIGDEYVELGAGESATVPADTMHHWMALDEQPVRTIATFSPGLSMGQWFENFHRVINAGEMNLVHAAVFAREYADSSPMPVDPGPAVWSFASRVLAPIGRMLGYKACT